MKKLILSVVAMATLALTANAVVEKKNRTVVEYEVDSVSQVTLREAETTPSGQGVTVSGTVGKYTYVDLGLKSGIKWATCNLGASNPTEIGSYFAWGETKTKEVYDWSTYKWCENKNVDEFGVPLDFTKYITRSSYGTVDSLTVLEPADDAATANWGSGWRMPTSAEQVELLKGCTWEWVDDYNDSGAHGRLGTSKANGNSIFLPAAGYREGLFLNYCVLFGCYWSSSLYEYYPDYSNDLFFGDGSIYCTNSYRFIGKSVRAVTK